MELSEAKNLVKKLIVKHEHSKLHKEILNAIDDIKASDGQRHVSKKDDKFGYSAYEMDVSDDLFYDIARQSSLRIAGRLKEQIVIDKVCGALRKRDQECKRIETEKVAASNVAPKADKEIIEKVKKIDFASLFGGAAGSKSNAAPVPKKIEKLFDAPVVKPSNAAAKEQDIIQTELKNALNIKASNLAKLKSDEMEVPDTKEKLLTKIENDATDFNDMDYQEHMGEYLTELKEYNSEDEDIEGLAKEERMILEMQKHKTGIPLNYKEGALKRGRDDNDKVRKKRREGMEMAQVRDILKNKYGTDVSLKKKDK